MTIWERISRDLQESAGTISEKASEMFKSGAEAVKEGAEKASARAAYATRLAQINWEERDIRRSMKKEFVALGELLYDLQTKKRLADFSKEAKPYFDRLAEFEKVLEKLENEKADLPKQYGLETIDKDIVRQLTRDLSEGGGTIMQVTLVKGSPVIGKKLKEIDLPKEALFGTVVRDERILIPDGETTFMENDKVSILGKEEDVEDAIQRILPKSS